jgi:hypothetical protein
MAVSLFEEAKWHSFTAAARIVRAGNLDILTEFGSETHD